MSKRSRVVAASIMAIIGVGVVVIPLLGGTDLKAAGVAEVGFDFTKILIGIGIGLLVLSALLFVSASAE